MKKFYIVCLFCLFVYGRAHADSSQGYSSGYNAGYYEQKIEPQTENAYRYGYQDGAYDSEQDNQQARQISIYFENQITQSKPKEENSYYGYSAYEE